MYMIKIILKLKKSLGIFIYKDFIMNMTIENLSAYCNNKEKIGIFCRYIQFKNIFDSNNTIFAQKHIIFF